MRLSYLEGLTRDSFNDPRMPQDRDGTDRGRFALELLSPWSYNHPIILTLHSLSVTL